MAGMFAYIAGSPFVFIKLYGVPAEHYGWLFGSNAAGFILVAQVNARLLAKRQPAFLLARTVWVHLAQVRVAVFVGQAEIDRGALAALTLTGKLVGPVPAIAARSGACRRLHV